MCSEKPAQFSSKMLLKQKLETYPTSFSALNGCRFEYKLMSFFILLTKNPMSIYRLCYHSIGVQLLVFIVFMSLFVIEAVETTTFLLLPQAGDIDQSTEKPAATFFVRK